MGYSSIKLNNLPEDYEIIDYKIHPTIHNTATCLCERRIPHETKTNYISCWVSVNESEMYLPKPYFGFTAAYTEHKRRQSVGI
jgi:hypothetical protein